MRRMSSKDANDFIREAKLFFHINVLQPVCTKADYTIIVMSQTNVCMLYLRCNFSEELVRLVTSYTSITASH